MSLQVCHCGWSKVTSYHGLRTHQGKMGCTAKGMRVEESEQQCMWGNAGFTKSPKDLMLDDYTSVTTDPTDYFSDMSLQVCHCGWSKVTSYHGLRTHQGKMGCTPKGIRIPKEEQNLWRNQWEEVGERKRQPAGRMSVKKENSPSPPSTSVRNVATIKREYESATSQGHAASRMISPQVNRAVREHLTSKYPATVARPKEKDRKDQTLSRVNGSVRERPAIPPRVTVQAKEEGSNFQKVLQRTLLRELSATINPAAAVKPGNKYREDRTPSRVRQDRITADLKHSAQARATKGPQRRSSVKSYMDSLDAEWLEITAVFSELMRVVEEAKQNLDLSFSIGTLRTTTSTMMKRIHQKLEHLSPIELAWISKFAVDVKLDPATAHRCLVSADGKRVRNRRVNQDAARRLGSVMGLNRLTWGKSYWEVEVSNTAGWYLGVTKRDVTRKGKLSLNPENGCWVAVHYGDEKYAAMTAPPVSLSLKEKPQKVGVFVDHEDGVVSFYDVTAQSHIYSFTECSFSGEISPYFCLQLQEDGESADHLVISTVKHQ